MSTPAIMPRGIFYVAEEKEALEEEWIEGLKDGFKKS